MIFTVLSCKNMVNRKNHTKICVINFTVKKQQFFRWCSLEIWVPLMTQWGDGAPWWRNDKLRPLDNVMGNSRSQWGPLNDAMINWDLLIPWLGGKLEIIILMTWSWGYWGPRWRNGTFGAFWWRNGEIENPL